MLSADATSQRADQIFRTGPETLVAASSGIIAGHISHFAKEVLSSSPPGPDGFPVEWKATGEVDEPRTLKGTPRPAPIHFSRLERSFVSAAPTPAPRWAQQYGELSATGDVVLFYSSPDDQTPSDIFPSAAGEQDLAALVKDIVSFQSVAEPKKQIDGWLAYLNSSRSGEASRVALRSLVQLSVEWGQIDPVMRKLLSSPDVPRDTRDYAFAFVAFQITHDVWQKEVGAALELLCSAFQAQKDANSQVRNLDGLLLVLDFTSKEPLQDSRRPLRHRIETCLKSWASSGVAAQASLEEYKRLQQRYKLQ
jgi:hypothetical protein